MDEASEGSRPCLPWVPPQETGGTLYEEMPWQKPMIVAMLTASDSWNVIGNAANG